MKKLFLIFNVLFSCSSIVTADQDQSAIQNTLYETHFSKTWLFGGDLIVQWKSNANFEFTHDNKIQLSAHLPGFQDVDVSGRKPDLIIEHSYCESNPAPLRQESEKIFLQSQWHDSIPTDFIHFLYGACRLEWIKQNIFPVHAACIGNDEDGYILIMGPPGSGKTSLTLHNAINHQVKIFSGDKTLITFNDEGQMEAIAGTRTLTVRTEDIPKWSGVEKINENTFGDRYTFQLASQYYSSSQRVPIKQIFFINLNDGISVNSHLSALSALHKLYPFFLDKQREDILIDGDQSFLDGAIAKGTKQELIHNLHKTLQHINVYTITDSLKGTTSFIHEHSDCVSRNKNMNTSKKVLFGICGIGNGHCNRQLPIIRSLLDQGHQIMIFTYGEGLTFFNDKIPSNANISIVHVENPYFVGTPEGIDFEKTALIEKNNIDFNHINSLAMHKATAEFGKPDLVISDYEMVAAQYAYARQAPLITLDQQSKYLVGDFCIDLNGTSYRDEIDRLSMFFPRATRRIAVSFFNVNTRNSQNDIVVEIHPPILRPEIIEAKKEKQDEKPLILVYVTAQQLREQPIDAWINTIKSVLPRHLEAHIFLPKRLALPINDANLYFYHHGDNKFDSLLFSCQGIISTAGHTLLSEAMYLEKPVYALPLPLYEQQLNAHIIQQGGFGMSQDDLTEDALSTFINNLELYKNNIHNDKTLLLKDIGNDSVLREINIMLRSNQ